MILLDNSEYMRNGDYVPTRMEAQEDAANLLVGQKTQSHPESTVGISAGTELLVSPTDDMGKILSALHGLPLKQQEIDICASVQVASLALKHRRNKNGAQRIVLFVGSPLSGVEPRALQKAGKQLKKNNVAIDVVAMGELEENEGKLQDLITAAGAEGRSCHLVTIPPGVLPSDVLISSPIVHGDAGGGGGGGGGAAAAAAGGGAGFGGGDLGGGFAEFGGVDPNMDPELAMALRVSMEEERARQERAAQESAAAAAAEAPAAAAEGESKQQEQDNTTTTNDDGNNNKPEDMQVEGATAGMTEEEELLQQALAMSMNEDGKPEEEEQAPEQMQTDEDDDDAAMQLALRMSMQPEEAAAAKAEETKQPQQQQQFQDPQFVNQLLGSLPGVDPNDPAIQSALKNLKKDGDDDKKDEGGDKKE